MEREQRQDSAGQPEVDDRHEAREALARDHAPRARVFASPRQSRLCRPGSILGPQQYFLLESEEMLKAEGEKSPIWTQVQMKLTEE